MATIDRSGAEALIPEEVSREIIQNTPRQSAIMQLARRLPNMPRGSLRMPILTALVQSYFVEGEANNTTPTDGMKSTTQAAWENRYINAAEIATIVPIPEAVLDEADYDIWAEVQPRIEESIGRLFDAAVLYGTNAPTSWPDGIVPSAATAGNTIAESAPDTAPDLYDVILSEDGVVSMVEEDGFDVTGHLGALRLRSKLRGLRDANGQPIFMRNMQDSSQYTLDGVDAVFPMNGGVDPATALLVSGDFNQLVWAVRQDITYRMLDQAILQNPDGTIMYNLAQQNMVALRCTFRAGWQLPNPMNPINDDPATRYPFAALTPYVAP